MNVRVDLNSPIKDGQEVVFRAPCSAAKVTGLVVYYPVDGVMKSQTFAFADAHGNNVGDIDHLFAENVVVKVILDVTTSMAFVQNADTNAYLENKLSGIDERLSAIEEGIPTQSWEEVQKAVRLGLAPGLFPVGTQFLVKNSLVGDFLYDVVAHDHFTSVDDESAHTMTLMCHDALLWDQYPYEGGIPYDHPEAFYVNDTDEDLPAGFYSFQMPITHYNWTIGYYYAFIAGKKVGDEYYPLEPNGKVELCNEGGPEIYPTRDNDLSLHYTLIPKYNEDGTSEYGDRFATGAIYGPYATLAEAKAVAAENGTYQGHLGKVGALTEADHSINYWQRITKGSNNYKNSVIREAILHSASENLDGNQSKFDTTTADRSTGDRTVSLVDYFDPEFLAVVGKVLVPCVTGGKYEPYGTDLAIEDWVEDTFFLPSLKEVTGDDNIANDLSTQLEYFKDASNVDRIKYANGYASYWWTRSPGPASNAYTVYAIKTNGDKTNVSPDVARGIVPMVNIVG